MKTRSIYGPEVASRAQRVIADVFAAMGRRARHAVLVGGAVPRLLEDVALRGAPGHAGTMDADILLDSNVFGSDDYATLADRLHERGYRYRQDADGNDLQFSFEVDVDGHGVVVDFLAPPMDAEPGFRVRLQPGLHAHAISGAHIPEWFSINLTLDEELLQGGRLPVRIRLVDVPGFVVLKALAFEDRQAPKDAYDLCYVLTYAREGPPAIADRLARHADDAEVARAVAYLRTAFSSPDAAGSVAVAVFEEARGEDVARQAALAYAVVQSFLTGWDDRDR
ncbi:nucleotidyl transferase AbiEii/AbiGii toxin family protein [Candidatus Palauibacter irciniicola]|uniref:nucleotidyl transferase AbiEii/AbiGii toxin family protein n=1 Tax=Candidatus Palauibacter irciniicola TaxID=3056733 RepID=UPI003B024B9D